MGLNEFNLPEDVAETLKIGDQLAIVDEEGNNVKKMVIDKLDASGRSEDVKVEAKGK